MKRKRILFGVFLLFFCAVLCSCGGREEEIRIEQPKETESLEVSDEAAPQETVPQKPDSEQKIWVDVSGAVKRAGVYELEVNSRVFEAVEAAGGFTEDADTQWLNQAAVVTDGEKLRVYTKEEAKELEEQGADMEAKPSVSKEDSQGKINVNTASVAELQEIPGIGEVRAKAIAAYREANGGFQSIEAIQEVSGIKGKTFEKIADYITVK